MKWQFFTRVVSLKTTDPISSKFIVYYICMNRKSHEKSYAVSIAVTVVIWHLHTFLGSHTENLVDVWRNLYGDLTGN